jgi:hypothetical protein
MSMPDLSDPQPLLLCAKCKAEMCLLGIESFDAVHELYTFECDKCGHLEAKTVHLRTGRLQ